MRRKERKGKERKGGRISNTPSCVFVFFGERGGKVTTNTALLISFVFFFFYFT